MESLKDKKRENKKEKEKTKALNKALFFTLRILIFLHLCFASLIDFHLLIIIPSLLNSTLSFSF